MCDYVVKGTEVADTGVSFSDVVTASVIDMEVITINSGSDMTHFGLILMSLLKMGHA